MSEFYDINSTKVSHREYWWGTKSPLVLIGWLIKWLRIRIPGSTGDPNVDSILPFVVESLPAEIGDRFAALGWELAALGFVDPIYHVIHDHGTKTTVYWATFRHNSGRHFARIHHRVWRQTQKVGRGLFPLFMTGFADGTFLVSSAGKPDLAAPDTVQVNRMPGAAVPSLWAAHERLAAELSERRMVSPVTTREELLVASERQHLLVRDFHLGRGVFRQRSAARHAEAEAYAAGCAQAGVEHAGVLAELERIQQKKPGWGGALWVLAGSLVVFLAVGATQWKWKFMLWIVPVLLFHEAGHWVAMRLAHYRNLRMFFIPFFGAAVTGQNWNVPGWKKALVSLAGPLPGIGVGVVAGLAGAVLGHGWLMNAALALLIVNGFNLLPVLPFDGGHVLQDTLFCRNRWLDGVFRLMAVLGLLGLGLLGGMRVLYFLAVPMAISLPLVFRLGKITDDLRRQPLPPPLPEEQTIPTPTAQAIIDAIRQAFPAKITLSDKMLAQHTLTVFERLNARPPGILATLSLLALHAGAFGATLVAILVLGISRQGGLGDFALAAVRQPQHVFRPGDVETLADQAQTDASTARNRIAATLRNRAAAVTAFQALTNRAASSATVTRLADSLVVSVPVADDAARERWFDELVTYSTNTFVALSNRPMTVSLICIAPTAVAATNLTRDMEDYLLVGGGRIGLIAPWSPEGRRGDFEVWRRARAQWTAIGIEVRKAGKDPALEPFRARIEAASKRGSEAEVARLWREQSQKLRDLQAEVYQRLRAQSNSAIAPGLVDLHARLGGISPTNQAGRASLHRELAGKLGELPLSADGQVQTDLYGVNTGSVSKHGPLIEMRWLGFGEVTRGLPAMVDWLAGLGCCNFKYDLEGSGWFAGLDEEED